MQWTSGPMDRWTIGSIEHWRIGTLEHWSIRLSISVNLHLVTCFALILFKRLRVTLVSSIASRDWVKIWKSCCCRRHGYIIDHHDYKSSCRSYQRWACYWSNLLVYHISSLSVWCFLNLLKILLKHIFYSFITRSNFPLYHKLGSVLAHLFWYQQRCLGTWEGTDMCEANDLGKWEKWQKWCCCIDQGQLLWHCVKGLNGKAFAGPILLSGMGT